MLFLIFFDYKFFINTQSGFFVDFFFKKISEVIVRNVFVYTALFFGEKYMIEVLTKKIIESTLTNINKYTGWTTLNHSWFLSSVIIFVLYMLFCINVFVYLL